MHVIFENFTILVSLQRFLEQQEIFAPVPNAPDDTSVHPAEHPLVTTVELAKTAFTVATTFFINKNKLHPM